MPPSAASNRPARSRSAPVKAPFRQPKSSLSSRVSGKAAQFTATKGLAARGLPRWMARAISSLPVPVSPEISTVALARLAHAIRPKTCCISGLSPTIPSRAGVRAGAGSVGFEQPARPARELLDARPQLRRGVLRLGLPGQHVGRAGREQLRQRVRTGLRKADQQRRQPARGPQSRAGPRAPPWRRRRRSPTRRSLAARARARPPRCAPRRSRAWAPRLPDRRGSPRRGSARGPCEPAACRSPHPPHRPARARASRVPAARVLDSPSGQGGCPGWPDRDRTGQRRRERQRHRGRARATHSAGRVGFDLRGVQEGRSSGDARCQARETLDRVGSDRHQRRYADRETRMPARFGPISRTAPPPRPRADGR